MNLIRKVTRVGNSLSVAIPPDWAKITDYVEVEKNDDGTLDDSFRNDQFSLFCYRWSRMEVGA